MIVNEFTKSKKYIKQMKEEYPLDAHYLALHLVDPNSFVLSAGCGAGREVRFLRQRGCKVVAVDHDPDMLAESIAINPSVSHILEDLTEFQSKKKFDYIVAIWNVINFMNTDERAEFISRCGENLRNGGKLIMTTSHIFHKWRHPFFNIKHRRQYYYFPREIDMLFQHSPFKLQKLNIGNTDLIVATK